MGNTLLYCLIISIVGSCGNDPKIELPTNGLVAHYPLDGNANDFSGNGFDGTINDAVATSNRKNTANSALEFNGSSSNVDFDDIHDDVTAGSDKKFSMSFWIFHNATATNNLIISKLGDSDCAEDQRQYTIRLVDNKVNSLLWYSLGSSTFRRWQGETILAVNTWYHIVVNYDGSVITNDGADRLTIHINGSLETMTLDGSTGLLGDIQIGTAHLGLGNRLDSNGNNCSTDRIFNGRIDDVRIYNRLLLLSEIEALGQE